MSVHFFKSFRWQMLNPSVMKDPSVMKTTFLALHQVVMTRALMMHILHVVWCCLSINPEPPHFKTAPTLLSMETTASVAPLRNYGVTDRVSVDEDLVPDYLFWSWTHHKQHSEKLLKQRLIVLKKGTRLRLSQTPKLLLAPTKIICFVCRKPQWKIACHLKNH